MTNDDKKVAREITDADVSSAYRATAADTSPARMDRMILQEATRAVNSDKKPAGIIGWLRPATFVATAGLCVALLFEFGEYQDVSSPPDIVFDALNFSPDVVADKESLAEPAAVIFDDSANNVRTPVPATQRPGQGQADPDRDTQNDFSRAASEAAKQVRAVDTAADAALSEMPEYDPEVAKPAASAAAIATLETAAAESSCPAEQRSQADTWWLCIERLRAAGHRDLADSETQRLRDAHPGFSPPR